MDAFVNIKTKWEKEFNVELPAEIVSRLDCEARSPLDKTVIHKLSTLREETNEKINSLKTKLKQEEYFSKLLSAEIDELRKQSELSLLDQDVSEMYAQVNKPPKRKQAEQNDTKLSSSRGSTNSKSGSGCEFDLGYEEIKFEVIEKDEEIIEKKETAPIKKEARRSVRDKIKMFERSDSESPEDGGDYEAIVMKPVPPMPTSPKPSTRRRPQENEYEEIALPTDGFAKPKVVIVQNANSQSDSNKVQTHSRSSSLSKRDDTNVLSTDEKTKTASARKSPIKPPKPLRSSRGKEECDLLIKPDKSSPQFSENEPKFSNSLKKQHVPDVYDTKDDVFKKITDDSDEEGDYCTLKVLSKKDEDKPHVSVVRVKSDSSESSGPSVQRETSGDMKNVTILSVNKSNRELSRSTENLSTLTVKSTTISKSVEDLTSRDNYQESISNRKSNNGKLNDDQFENDNRMKKSFNMKTEQPGVQSPKLPEDSDDGVVCKSFKSASSSGSEEDPERLNTVTVDIAGLLTPEEIAAARANNPSPVNIKKKRRGKVPDYEKWDFQHLLTQPGISLVDNEFTDTGSEDDMYDNVPTEKPEVPFVTSDDSGVSETTTPDEKLKSNDSIVRTEIGEPRKESMMSSSTEGSRVSTASCVTVDGDSVFLQRCDSTESHTVLLSPSPVPKDERSKSIDEDNISVSSNDDLLDKGDFEETLTEESARRYGTSSSKQLHMRHLVVRGILESEKAYLHVIHQLCQAKHFLQSAAMNQSQGGSGIAPEDVTTIFYKLDDIYQIHKDFVEELDEKIRTWTDDQSVAKAFKTMIVYFKVYEDYVNNYPVAVETIRRYQENEDSKHLLEHRRGPRNCIRDAIVREYGKACVSKIRLSSVSSEQMEAFKDDAIRLEEILLKPVQRIQTNNLVLHDLIKHTPESHVDYEDLQKALRLSEENLKTYNNQQANLSRRKDAPESRHLVKSGFLVEVSRDKKQTRQLRYVFLFNDMLICTKHKGGTRHKEVSFKFLWSLPISALTIHVKGERKYELKESLEDLKCKIGNLKSELREEMLKADGVKDKAFSLSQKKIARNIEKLKKKVQEQEATLVEALPRLPLNLEADTFKGRTFLFPTDYERAEWREAIECQCGKYRGQAAVQVSNHECEVLIDNTKLHMQVNGIGTVLLKKDEEMLNGSLNVTIHKMQGLESTCEVYCCIEMDSYGHFYKKAQTRVCKYIHDASWDEDFELELDGSQTLRILCYKKQPVDEDDLIIGKCALELSLSWLNSKFNEKTISMNDLSITISIRHTPASRTLKRTQSKLRSGVFGVRIANITKRENRTVPNIVTTCVQQVESRGLHEVGIYRVSGVTSEVQNLKKIFDKNPIIAGNQAENADINAVTGVLKLFFRELPEPLFTEQNYQSFVQTIELQNEEAKEKCLLDLLHSLPEANYYTIVYIVEHLVRIAAQSAHNKMSISNLATIFGPTLLHPAVKDSNVDPTILMVKAARDASLQSEILHFLIKLAASGKNIRKSASMSSSESASTSSLSSSVTESSAL